jgi:hypothetical protein
MIFCSDGEGNLSRRDAGLLRIDVAAARAAATGGARSSDVA